MSESEGTSKRAAHKAGSLVSPWPADALEVIEAALERIEGLELELAAVKGWRIMRALERGLGLQYRVQRNEWAVLDGTDDPMTRRTLPEAIALALQLRDHRVALAAQMFLQHSESVAPAPSAAFTTLTALAEQLALQKPEAARSPTPTASTPGPLPETPAPRP